MRWFSDKRSFALAFTLPILCLIIFICTTLLVICQNDLLLAYRECNLIRAYYIADAGMADGYTQLRAAGASPSNFSFTKNYPVSGANDAGTYNVSVVLTTPGTWPVYTITSKGTYPSTGTHTVSKTLQLTVQLTSFSHWAYMTNTEICYYPGWEGAESFWVTGNIVNGPLQVNDHLFVAGNPWFNGPVSVADTKVTYYDAPGVDNPLFKGGLWLGAPVVPLPDPTPLLTAIKTAASQPGGGLLIDSTDYSDPLNPQPGLYRGANGTHTDTSIQFLNNGTMIVTNKNKYLAPTTMSIPANGAIYVTGGEVDVKGIVNGQVTIGCDQNIWTSDNITYHNTSPGNPNPASTDVLGLVARTNVIFPNDLQDKTNKDIDAYIVALNGSFYLENMGAVPDVKGNLIQYGGVMAQWSATVFGCFNGAGVLQFGYLQIPYYDDRLTSLVPPCFTPAQDFNGLKYRRILLKEL